jgi:hypothetical protein
MLDQVQQRREHARLGHPRLVDDEDAAVRHSALAAGVEKQPVQRPAGNAGGGGELVRGAAAGRRANDIDARPAVGIGERT